MPWGRHEQCTKVVLLPYIFFFSLRSLFFYHSDFHRAYFPVLIRLMIPPLQRPHVVFPLPPRVVQVYIDLTLKALKTPPVSAGKGDGIPSSPESLLSRAESYTDQAMTAGSRLPLARLVKGHALAMREQHEVKMPTQNLSLLFSALFKSFCPPLFLFLSKLSIYIYSIHVLLYVVDPTGQDFSMQSRC